MTSSVRSTSGCIFCQFCAAGVIHWRAGISQTATFIGVFAPPELAGAAACGAVAGAWVGAAAAAAGAVVGAGAAPALAGAGALVGAGAGALVGAGAAAFGASVGGGAAPQAAIAAAAAESTKPPSTRRRVMCRIVIPFLLLERGSALAFQTRE